MNNTIFRAFGSNNEAFIAFGSTYGTVANTTTYATVDGICGKSGVFVTVVVLGAGKRDFFLVVGPGHGRCKLYRVLAHTVVDRNYAHYDDGFGDNTVSLRAQTV